MSDEPSMLTPVGQQVCPAVDLPLPIHDREKACQENTAYLQFADNVSKSVGKTVLNIGIKVDSKLIDILGAFSNLAVNSAALTAAYASLLLTFPDLDEKIQKYTKLAEEGWESAQKKSDKNNFSAGYVHYILPPSKEQQDWIEETKKLEKKIEDSNILVRAVEKGKHQAASLVPSKQTIQKEAVRGTAKAFNIAAKTTALAVNATAYVLSSLLYLSSDGVLGEETEQSTEEKIETGGSFLDKMSAVGQFFQTRHQYFNDHGPSYLQWIGPFAPYAILSGLAITYSGVAPNLLVSAWPIISSVAAFSVKSTQVVSDVKSRAAIDSIKSVLLKLHDVLKETKIPPSEYSDLFARAIVAISCPAYAVRDADEQLFAQVDKQNVTPFLYFLRYASYAYCLDPNTLKVADVTECNELNRQFSRRYYRIMDNVKGVEGLKNHLINFFIVYDLTISCFVVSFQGTTTLDDLLLDAFGKATPFDFTDNTNRETRKTVNGFAHEAMLQVARNCVSLILQKLKKDHPFYQRVPIITTGHSLGAGVAAIATMLLRQQGVYAFCVGIATPACLSPTLAEVCEPYVVSIINNADIVPRLSECALFNLTSDDRVCARSDIKKLLAPGNVFWMREKLDDGQELVQLKANNPFVTSILARIDCLTAHATASYLQSMKSINPSADPFAIDLDFSLLLPTLPPRKLEPEFLMLYLPPNVAAAIKSCINKRDMAKVQRSDRKKEDVEKARGPLPSAQLIAMREEVTKTRDEFLKQYTELLNEKKALEKRVKELEDSNKI